MKNLVFVGKVLHRLTVAGVLKPEDEERESVEEDREEGEEQGVRDLQWLVGRMLRLARFEAAQHPKESLKVNCTCGAKKLQMAVRHSTVLA